MRLTRSDALAFGALAAGCGFVSSSAEDAALPLLQRLAAFSPGLVRARAADRGEAASLAAGASFAGGRALAVACAGPSGDFPEVLAWCVERRLPLVVFARPDLFPAGRSYRVEDGASPALLFEAVVEAFERADRDLCPVVVDPGENLGEAEIVDDLNLEREIKRGQRKIPAQDAAPPSVAASWYCIPTVLPLLERPPVAAAEYLPTGRTLDLRCAGGRAALTALAGAWSRLCVPVREVVLVSSGGCCPGPAPLGRTYGLAAAQGRAVAVAAGVKLAHPGLTAAVIGGLREFGGPGPGLGAFLGAARSDADLICLMLRRPGDASDIDPLEAAFGAGVKFIARCGASGLPALAARAVVLRGLSFIDVLSPCGSSPEPQSVVLRDSAAGRPVSATTALACAGLTPGRAEMAKKALA